MSDDHDLALPDLSSLSIDLTPFRYQDGDDDEFISKANGKQVYLEEWSTTYNAAIIQYGALFVNYLEQAQNVPIEIRQQFEQLVTDANSSLDQMRTLLISSNLPKLDTVTPGSMLRVNSDGTGYESISVDGLLSGMQQQDITPRAASISQQELNSLTN